MRKLKALLAAGILVALALIGLPPAAAASPVVLDRGEIGVFDIGLDAGAPIVQARDATGLDAAQVVHREPGDIEIRLDGGAARVDEDGQTRFATADDIGSDLPVLTWSTERVPLLAESTIALTVDAAGPGDVRVTVEDAEEKEQVWDGAQSRSGVLTVEVGAAGLATWSFSEPGAYRVGVVPTWQTPDGMVTGQPAVYAVTVTAPDDERGAGEQREGRDAQESGESGRTTTKAAPLGDGAVTEPCFGLSVPEDAETVDDGHFDFGVQVSGGTLVSLVKDDRPDPAVWRSPEELLFRLDEPALMQVPDREDFGFLGEPGEDIWTIGQSQETGVPWLGWNTQHPSAVNGISGGTTWTLDEVEGPGELFIYQIGSFGEIDRVMGSPSNWPDEVTIPRNVHAHGNWTFTEPGVYRVTTTHTARLSDGGTARSTATLTFLVGPCDAAEPRPEDDLDPSLLLNDAELAEADRGGVEVSPDRVSVGDRVTLTVPAAAEGDWLMPVVYSDPQQIGWKQANASGSLTNVVIPELEEGAHKIAAYTADGELAGWTPITVTSADDGDDGGDNGDGDGNGDGNGDGDGNSGGGDGSGGGAPGGSGGGAAVACTPGAGGSAGGSGGSGSAGTVSDGHFDFGPIIEGGRMIARVKDDRSQPPRWIDPGSVVFQIGSAAEQQVPNDSAYSFLGSPGSKIWMIPQTQVDGVPWLGWNTQHETTRSQLSGPVTFRLDRVDGPGKLAVYLTNSFGGVGEKKFGNVSGFPSSMRVPLNVHAHGNWAFTEPGTYRVAMTMSGSLRSGGNASASATLTFVVGGGSGASASSASAQDTRHGGAVVSALAVNGSGSTVPAAEENGAATATQTGTADNCTLPKTGAPDLLGELFAMAVLAMLLGTVAIAFARRRGGSGPAL